MAAEWVARVRSGRLYLADSPHICLSAGPCVPIGVVTSISRNSFPKVVRQGLEPRTNRL